GLNRLLRNVYGRALNYCEQKWNKKKNLADPEMVGELLLWCREKWSEAYSSLAYDALTEWESLLNGQAKSEDVVEKLSAITQHIELLLPNLPQHRKVTQFRGTVPPTGSNRPFSDEPFIDTFRNYLVNLDTLWAWQDWKNFRVQWCE